MLQLEKDFEMIKKNFFKIAKNPKTRRENSVYPTPNFTRKKYSGGTSRFSTSQSYSYPKLTSRTG